MHWTTDTFVFYYFRLPSSSASPDHENCWTPSSTPAPASVSILPSHRVTFNDKNEVASQDRDGTFTVTYSQLGEKISQKSSGEHLPKRPGGLKVQFGETSCVETVELPFKLTEYSRNVTFDEDSLLSYKRWVKCVNNGMHLFSHKIEQQQ